MDFKKLLFEKDSVFLVTGGAGFIGSHICQTLLDMGYKVHCMDDFSTGKRQNIIDFENNPNFTLIEGSITDFEICKKSVEGVNYVLHQAAWGSVPRSLAMPLEYGHRNIMGTFNMMEASRLYGVKRFVYASSSSVYGDHPDTLRNENNLGNPISPYALTKKVDEDFGKLYYSVYGLETIGLRYFNVFGPRQNPDGFYAAAVPRFIKQIINNEQSRIFGDGKQTRAFTYIQNVVSANLLACLAPDNAVGQAYNIATSECISVIELYQNICDILGVEPNVVFEQERKGDIKHAYADICKAQSLLGYSPTVTFNDGLSFTIEWFKK